MNKAMTTGEKPHCPEAQRKPYHEVDGCSLDVRSDMDCPYRKGQVEGPDYCTLNESLCALETGYECDIAEDKSAKILTEDERVEIVRQALIAVYNTKRAGNPIYLEDADSVWEARARTVLRALAGSLKDLDSFDLSQLSRREGTYWTAKDLATLEK